MRFGWSLLEYTRLSNQILNCFEGEITYFARHTRAYPPWLPSYRGGKLQKGGTLLHDHEGYREPKDCVVLMDNSLVKTFAPFNGRDCTRNGFMARDVVRGAEARSLLIKYDAYLLIRSKLYPHYLVHFLVYAKHFSARRLVLILPFNRDRGGTDQSAAYLKRDRRRYR